MADANEREVKRLSWIGSARLDLARFPDDARRKAGHQLHKVQCGLEADDWKSFSDIGPGTSEIRIRCPDGIFRVMLVARFVESVYVLHCFHKKSQATGLADKLIAKKRYAEMLNSRKVLP